QRVPRQRAQSGPARDPPEPVPRLEEHRDRRGVQHQHAVEPVRPRRARGARPVPLVVNHPRVTVVIATYNWATVLPYSIGSVLDQTFTDFELLVVGEGCTDESDAVVTRIGDPRVQWHNLATNRAISRGRTTTPS